VNNLMGERAVVRSVTLCRELRLLGLTIEGWDAKRICRHMTAVTTATVPGPGLPALGEGGACVFVIPLVDSTTAVCTDANAGPHVALLSPRWHDQTRRKQKSATPEACLDASHHRQGTRSTVCLVPCAGGRHATQMGKRVTNLTACGTFSEFVGGTLPLPAGPFGPRGCLEAQEPHRCIRGASMHLCVSHACPR
jgi:hypothetical protein